MDDSELERFGLGFVRYVWESNRWNSRLFVSNKESFCWVYFSDLGSCLQNYLSYWATELSLLTDRDCC